MSFSGFVVLVLYFVHVCDVLYIGLPTTALICVYDILLKLGLYARRSGPLSREGSLSWHTCCDMGPRFFRSRPKIRPIQSPLTTRMGMWRNYSNPDPLVPIQSPLTTPKGILTRILARTFT
jgi:hypothetical protein